MVKCDFCKRKTNYECSSCGKSFCKEHGDIDRMLCYNCLELEETQKENEREFAP